MFEHKSKPLLNRSEFIKRMIFFALLSAGFVAFSLFAGMLGYRMSENFSWIDAFVNAAMLMGGMGPVNELHTDAGKIFAGVYSLYCGLVFIIAVGFLVAPVFHRFLHKFHLEADETISRNESGRIKSESKK
jgi:phosphate/sulfate permease